MVLTVPLDQRPTDPAVEVMEAAMRRTVPVATPVSAHHGSYRRHVDLLRVVSAACPA